MTDLTPHDVIVQVLGNTFGTGSEYATDILSALESAGYTVKKPWFDTPPLPVRMRAAADVLEEASDRYGPNAKGVDCTAWDAANLRVVASRWELEDTRAAGREQAVEELATAMAARPRGDWHQIARDLVDAGWHRGE